MTRANNFRATLNEVVNGWKCSANAEVVGDHPSAVVTAHWNIEIRSNEDGLTSNVTEVFECWYRCH